MKHDDLHQAALDETGFWGKQGAGCIIVSRTTGRVLLPLRSALVLEPLTWGVFGGAVDPNEDLRTSVCRETDEESGLKVDADEMVRLYVFTDESSGFRYTTYLAFVDGEPETTLNSESAKTQWFEFGSWPDPLHYGLKRILDSEDSVKLMGSYCNKFKGRFMDNATINDLKCFMKKHHAYCSFNCLPIVRSNVDFSLRNGIFKKLFIADHNDYYHRARQMVQVAKFLEKKSLKDFNKVISESETTPLFIIVSISGVTPDIAEDCVFFREIISVDEVSVSVETASSIEQAKAVIEANFDPTTVFMVKHYLPDSARTIYYSLVDKNFGVNITKKKNFGGYNFEATVNTYSLCYVPKGHLQEVCDILYRSFPDCKMKYKNHGRSSGWTGAETINFKFDRLSELNRLKLHNATKEMVLNVNVSIDALTGKNV